jgi:hypothetical protein
LMPWFFLFAAGHFGWQLVKGKAAKTNAISIPA